VEPSPAASRRFDEVLALERAGEDVFTARLDGFGGVTLGCAALAAARTCEGRALHALSACFLRPVAVGASELRVERLAEGRRIARRRVRIGPAERPLFELVASFAAAGTGPDFDETEPDPATPAPEELPSDVEVARAERWSEEGGRDAGEWPIAWRWVGAPWRPAASGEPSRYRAWVRPRVPLAGDPGLQVAALAFLSDFHSHWPVARRLGGGFEPERFTSLDTAIWIHRDRPWDDWWLLTSASDVAHGGRALTRRSLHAREGPLVATMLQEALVLGR
jgi:acyl-CoA thioesterase II